MSEHVAALAMYEIPRHTEPEAATLIRPHRPPSAVTMRKYRRAGKLGFARIFGEVLYSDKHLDDFRRACERAVTRSRAPR